VQVFAQDGDRVAEGDAILELSSMKLFYAVNAPCAGTLTGLSVAPGDQVSSGEVLCDVILNAEDTAAATASAA
jgi:acetyl-CoA/propionyl-CoA carboxylase biotin carboxyl carrier protein